MTITFIILLLKSATPTQSVQTVEGSVGSGARDGKTRSTVDVAATANVVWPRAKVTRKCSNFSLSNLGASLPIFFFPKLELLLKYYVQHKSFFEYFSLTQEFFHLSPSKLWKLNCFLVSILSTWNASFICFLAFGI